MLLHFRSVHEETPGKRWKQLFDKSWPYYKKWYVSEGLGARPGYMTCYSKMREHMPELLPYYEKLVSLAGGGDLEARFLSMYNHPPYMAGCSQIAWTRDRVSLIRNYDYSPVLFEGLCLKTNWLQPVIGMSDCLWGLLDGMNGSGLSVALTFGGRRVVGNGFGILLLLRYVLEVCTNISEAVDAFKRLPVHMSYNVTVLDASGNYATIFLSPDRSPVVINSPVCVNHQVQIEWDDYARMSGTLERQQYLDQCLINQNETEGSIIKKFLQPPLFNTKYKKSFGTLYTAAFHPAEGHVDILWQNKHVEQSFSKFKERHLLIQLQSSIKNKLSL